MAVIVSSCSNGTATMADSHGFVSVSVRINGQFDMYGGSSFAVPADMLPAPADFAMSMSSADGVYGAEWPAMTDFDDRQSLMLGAYVVSLSSPGVNGGPAMAGKADFNVSAAERSDVVVECRPTDAVFILNASGASDGVALDSVAVHSDGDLYWTVPADGSRHEVFTSGGFQSYFARFSDASGRSVLLDCGFTTEVRPACGTAFDFSLSDGKLSCVGNGISHAIDIDNSLFSAHAPEVLPVGFVPGSAVHIDEGLTLLQPVGMSVSSSRPLRHVYLTVVSPALNHVDAPAEFDLLHLSDSERAFLDESGLRVVPASDGLGMSVVFTELLENMASFISTRSLFTLLAVDDLGLCSDPVVLDVSTKSVSFTLEDVSKAVMGSDTVSMAIVSNIGHLERQDFRIVCAGSEGAHVVCPVTSWQTSPDGNLRVAFVVPAGPSDVDIDVEYLGIRRASATVRRVAPAVSLDIDAFATSAIVAVHCATPAQAAALIEYGTFTVDGIRASVWKRYPEAGRIIVNGLSPSRSYKVGVDACGQSSVASAVCVTERDEPVPMANFDDWRVLYDYKNLPMGGRYSTTSLSIVNRQNFTDVYVQWPRKYWASNNAKTFCMDARNRNTWYMWPTATLEYGLADDIKAVRLTSVGWDHDGPEIPDYVQAPGQDLDYSRVVPHVAHRSAGRLWLGSYDYDPATGQETIRQDHGFSSRPSSLNGYFKYLPDVTDNDDYGLVMVEIINVTDGVETVIATGRYEFRTSPDYRTFSVPLSYAYFNLHATGLRIMFSSSAQIPENTTPQSAPSSPLSTFDSQPSTTSAQSYEDTHVPVTPWPELGRMSGSTLWLSALSFAY